MRPGSLEGEVDGSLSGLSEEEILIFVSLLSGRRIEETVRHPGLDEAGQRKIEALANRLDRESEGFFQTLVQAMKLGHRKGLSLRELSLALTWQSFEGLVSHALRQHGFQVERRVVLTSPRREIDILGEDLSLVLACDCKRWKRNPGPSELREIVGRQVERCEVLSERRELGKRVYPIVVLLQESRWRTVNEIPVVSVLGLNDFLLNLDGYVDDFRSF